MSVTALIVAAGKGERAGGAVPKQFAQLGDKAVVAHSIDAFAAHGRIDRIAVVIGDGQSALLSAAIGDRHIDHVITGGALRAQSVRAGLDAIGSCDIVLIHDAARPLLSAAVIDRLLDALQSADGAVPILPVADTLAIAGHELGDTVDRSRLVRVQTPQAFTYQAILAAHQRWTGGEATDDAQMARAAGFSVAMVEGDVMLEKITQPADFATAAARTSVTMAPRTGLGFDVHELVAGKPLWLCGVSVPHSHGLSGHSDADVALHALTDALLGAIAAGDIGDHFPPSDPQWRGAASSIFLTHARDLIARSGGRIVSVDLTIICEAPRIGPHRDAMRASLASLLKLDQSRVSVKATTTEGLGFTGRREGIAAQAIATVLMKE